MTNDSLPAEALAKAGGRTTEGNGMKIKRGPKFVKRAVQVKRITDPQHKA